MAKKKDKVSKEKKSKKDLKEKKVKEDLKKSKKDLKQKEKDEKKKEKLKVKEEKESKKAQKELLEKQEQEKLLTHLYNPIKYELITDELEIAKLFEDLNISSSIKLPKILVKDPISKIYKAKVNDIFKITRKSYTSKESVFYRVVVNE